MQTQPPPTLPKDKQPFIRLLMPAIMLVAVGGMIAAMVLSGMGRNPISFIFPLMMLGSMAMMFQHKPQCPIKHHVTTLHSPRTPTRDVTQSAKSPHQIIRSHASPIRLISPQVRVHIQSDRRARVPQHLLDSLHTQPLTDQI